MLNTSKYRLPCSTDLFLKEVCNARSLFSGYRRQHFVGRLEVASHHSCLVLEHRQEQWEADDVELLVAQVQAVITRNVAKQVHHSAAHRHQLELSQHDVHVDSSCQFKCSIVLTPNKKQIQASPVEMRYSDYFASHVVVESIDIVCIYEAVANPTAGFHDFFNLCDNIECVFDTILCYYFRIVLGILTRRLHRLGLVLEDEEGFLSGNTHHLTAFAPEHLQKQLLGHT